MLTRRGVLAAGATLAAGLGSAQAVERNFTFCSWGGALSDTEARAFLDPFAREKNIQINKVSPTSYPKLKAMVEAGAVEWDLVTTGGYFIYQGERQGLLEKIDYSIVKPGTLAPYWMSEYGVYTSTGATVIAYNTTAFPKVGPRSWKDFWDLRAFPGPRSLYSRPWYNYEAALRAADMARDQIYPVNDEKMQLMFQKLREIKPSVAVWWTAGAQPAQLLSTGEVAMAMAWDGRIADAMKENVPIAMTFDDALVWGNSWIVPKGTPYRELAMEAINEAISRPAQERLLQLNTYGPVLSEVAAEAPPERARKLETSPAVLANALVFNDRAVADMIDRYFEQWQRFLLS